MQFAQEIIKNPEMRSRLYEKFNSWRSHLTTSKLKTILLVSLISFTSLLVRQTLQVQHSCNPMIHWSGNLPAECQVAVTTNSKNPAKQQEIQKQQPQIVQKTAQNKPKSSVPQSSKLNTSDKNNSPNPNIAGAVAGTAAGVGVAAISIGVFAVAPPVGVFLGLGVAVVSIWQATKNAS